MISTDASPAAAIAAGGTAPPGVRKAGTSGLAGRSVLVTRPAEQARALAGAIEAAGARAMLFPTLRIESIRNAGELDRALRELARYELVVFVSANAALHSHARCLELGLSGLADVRCGAAPGPATAAALAARGVARVVVPETRFDSEGLIVALTQAAIAPRRALILRGADEHGDAASGGGRERLAEWLRGCGAAVESLACYRRARARVDPARVERLIAGPPPDAVLVTSSEGGEALLALLGAAGSEWLKAAPMLVPHPRIAARMRALGMGDVRVTAGGDHGILAGLSALFSAPGT